MKNQEIADLLEKMGTLSEIKGEIIFKTRAFFKAAENIRNLSEDLQDIKRQDRLQEIPGIGKEIAQKVTEYLDTGRMSSYDKLTKEIPESLLEVVKVQTVGPKKAKLFFEELNVKTVEDLKRALDLGKLAKLPKFKDKTIENIRKGIAVLQEGQKRMNLGTATNVAEEIMAQLKILQEVEVISTAGSLRRGRETIGDIDILVQSTHPPKVMEAFTRLPQVKQVLAHGATKASVLTQNNLQIDLRVIEPKSYGAALLYFTGSKQFNIRIRQIAQQKNMKVSEYGIFSVKGGNEKFLAGKTEEECLKVLGLPFIPPELREEIGEEAIFGGKKIPKLIETKDIQGDLHVHSTYSDGRNTIEEMVAAAQARGYQYLAISDHSERLRVAGGVSPADLLKKKKEIDKLNAKLKNFRIIFGTEVEIDSEGRLDYNEKILSAFDVVIAAIHSGFEQDSAKITKRLLGAIQNKYVNIIAHPTGVHLGKREPYAIDFKEVCRAAVEHNVFLEINAFPIRLDLNSANVYFAKSQGVQFAINSDSHSVDHLSHMRFGVTIARRGWLTKDDVVNTSSWEVMLKQMKKR